MDIVNPLLRTQRGNQYTLTVVDHFTKYVEAYVLPDQEAATIARGFLNEFISHFGVPSIIHTDQSANFKSHMFKTLFQLLNIKKTWTLSYHSQCDDQVERMNCTLIELLALNVANPTENWDFNLGLVLIAYRTAVQLSTKFTPHFMLFGREMRLLLDVMYLPPEASHTRFGYPYEVGTTLADAYDRAINRLNIAHKMQNDYYDRSTYGFCFSVDDLVWLWSPVVGKGVTRKLYKPWTGFCTVTKRLSDIKYEF